MDGFDTEKEANDCNGNIGKFTTWREKISRILDWFEIGYRDELEIGSAREEICHVEEMEQISQILD